MNAIERIVAVRSAGELVAGTSALAGPVETLAASFGPFAAPGTYHVVPADEARAVLEAAIHQDLAYGCEIVPREVAARLARAFIDEWPVATTRFHTNGTHGLPRRAGVGSVWQPATEATFDTGVLAIGVSSSACLWFLDED